MKRTRVTVVSVLLICLVGGWHVWSSLAIGQLEAAADMVHVAAEWQGTHFIYETKKLYEYQIVDGVQVENAILYVAYWREGSDPECFFSLFTWRGQIGIEIARMGVAKTMVYYGDRLLVEFREATHGEATVGYYSTIGL